jgi:acyl carrier protein
MPRRAGQQLTCDMKDGLHERLAALLADVCGAPVSSLGPEAAPGVTQGWDSVATLGFIAAVEEELAISITTAEAMTIKSLGDMARLVAAKLGPKVAP